MDWQVLDNPSFQLAMENAQSLRLPMAESLEEYRYDRYDVLISLFKYCAEMPCWARRGAIH
jgi:hypothetical protein